MPHQLHQLYGDHPSRVVNAYFPEQAGPGPPVIVYFHGGRWLEGHPDFYDHLAGPWVEAGAVFLSCGYRLEPEHTVADAIDDAVHAVEWARDNARRYGGDPTRRVVAGHSAGGHLTAMVAMTDWGCADGTVAGPVAGAICMSPPSDLRNWMPAGDEADRLSPVRRITHAAPATVVAHGDPEPHRVDGDDQLLTREGRGLSRALSRLGLDHRHVVMPGADHLTTATAFAEPTTALFASAAEAVFRQR